MLRRNTAHDDAQTVALTATTGQEFDIVLKPVSHPELGDIRIDENLFAIGRTEAPFDSYPQELTADLSRRHARIFSEYGSVYIADLGSKNGTSVNGVNIRQKTSRLQSGDEICFGGALSYRVQLGARAQAPARPRLLSLTLTPEQGELGLQPIVVTEFPFLVSKADATFARYKDQYPHQVNYISRRHAHIFLKGGHPFVEDLGSTNGTFVAGKRLDEHAVVLAEGDLLAFGGHHFVYKVSLQEEEAELDPTVTKLSQAVRRVAESRGDVEKTTFITEATTWVEIFCVDRAQQQEDELNEEERKAADEAPPETDRRPRGKAAVFASELASAFVGNDQSVMKRAAVWGAAVLALLSVFALVLYLREAPRQELKELAESGQYAQAATSANRYLARNPDNAEVRALGTEALLKANLPGWLALLRTREFDRAAAALAHMKKLGSNNADAQALLAELEWFGTLEKFVMGRGGPEAPIRLYADEDAIRALLRQWNEDSQARQRAFATISAYVPEFRDPYAEALSHLRKLQSDDAVYLSAIERLKAGVVKELDADRPEAIEPMLKEYAEKYPRIGALDGVRQDLRRYTDIMNEARARNLGRLVPRLEQARFATPPFQAKFKALQKGDVLPPAEVTQQYLAVSRAWRAGNATAALSGLQQMDAGPWAPAAAAELQRKKTVLEQFTQLRSRRGAADYDDRLLAFHAMLDPQEDSYFVRAAEADIGQIRDKALSRAQERLSRAQAKWNQYREHGAITSAQRLETAVSGKFRAQARLLTEAQDEARQGAQVYGQLKAEQPPAWGKLLGEIDAEAEQQRKSMQELRNVLQPSLLKTKLALLGVQNDDQGKPPAAAD